MKFALIRKKVKKAFLKIGVIPACPVVATLCEDSHRESFFVVLSTDACVQKDSRPPESFRDCGNDISGGHWMESHLIEEVVFK
jgi:hypothetical protein